MKSMKIYMLFAWTPALLSAAPFQKLNPAASKPRMECVNFQGVWTGECHEQSDGGSSITYSSRYEATQEGCETIELRDLIRKENRAYGIGRTTASRSKDFSPFISLTTYAQWQDGGKALSIDEFTSAEFQFESQKRISSSNLQVKFSYASDDLITLAQVFSSSVTSENGFGQYKLTLRCQYKITR